MQSSAVLMFPLVLTASAGGGKDFCNKVPRKILLEPLIFSLQYFPHLRQEMSWTLKPFPVLLLALLHISTGELDGSYGAARSQQTILLSVFLVWSWSPEQSFLLLKAYRLSPQSIKMQASTATRYCSKLLPGKRNKNIHVENRTRKTSQQESGWRPKLFNKKKSGR